jgi:1-acyl-sn-glycerol-3-phosphate acyltransferase
MWRPRNDCGAGCLPANGRSLPAHRQAGRLLALIAVLLAAAVALPFARRSAPFWARAVLRAVGVRLSARGPIPRHRALLVANHISWLDALAILAVAPSRLLAKRDVRGWPVIGPMASAAGTIFVDRSRPRTLPGTVAEVAAALRGDATVAVFPEGTTGCGAGVGPFRPAMFQAAIDAGARVVPLTLRYTEAGAAFVGDESLYASVRRVLAAPALRVTVTAAPALHPGAAATRRDLATVARMAVGAPRVPVPA